jgi:SPOR domain
MPTNYEPTDDVRVFDGGDDDEDVEGSRLPLLIVIALLVLAAFGGVVWLAYQRGVQQGHAEVPRVIAADQTPVKVPPTSAGGTATPYTGLKIYQQPAPSGEDAAADNAAPAPAPAPAANTPAPPPSMPAEVPATTPPLKVVSVPAVTPPPAKPQVAPQTAPALASEAPEPLPPKGASAPSVPSTRPVLPPAAPRVTAQVATAPVAATPVAAAPVASTAPAGAGLLQIGSYKSEADANTAWAAYKAKHAALLGGTSPNVMQVDLGAKGVWYRLRIVAGDKSAAASLCDKLKAEGAACIPTK